MAIKNNWIFRNLIGAVVFFVAVLIAAAVGLNLITRHGKNAIAPDFTNLSVEQARILADESHVGVKVVDSVFVKRLAAGVVYRQTPKAGAKVKMGRSIFLTINSVVPRKVVMPNLYGYSVTEARAELKNRGLSLGKLNYVKDIATNTVLGQYCNGVELNAGDLVVNGSNIDLKVGVGSEEAVTSVPNLIGLKYVSAVDAIHDRFLNTGRVTFDKEIKTYADSVDAVVYKQDTPGATKSLGAGVNIFLTLDPGKLPNDN